MFGRINRENIKNREYFCIQIDKKLKTGRTERRIPAAFKAKFSLPAQI